MPVNTGTAGWTGTVPDAPKSRPLQVAPAMTSDGTSVSADAATVATRARSGVTSPLPSGWTRFDRNTTNIFVAGSIQRLVPVNPVCPNDPNGSSSPRLDENDESMSHPSARTFGCPAGEDGFNIRPTVKGERIRTP